MFIVSMLFIYNFFQSVEQIDQSVGRDTFCTIMENNKKYAYQVVSLTG